MDKRRCPLCRRERDIEEFLVKRRKGYKDTREGRCRECRQNLPPNRICTICEERFFKDLHRKDCAPCRDKRKRWLELELYLDFVETRIA